MAERLVRDLRVPYVHRRAHRHASRASIGIASARDADRERAGARPQRRRRDVHGEGQRQGRLRRLRPRHARRHPRAPRARRRAAARGRPGPAPPGLPADRVARVRAHRRPRGARALAAPRARPGRARRVHRDRRGERRDPADRPLGPARGVRARPSAWQRGGLAAGPRSCASTSRRGRSSSRASSIASRRRWPGPASSRAPRSSRSPRPRCIKATPATVATLEALRDLGVRVVIDDFGTGYFSLSHLRQFPVDALKIASEFVQVADGDVAFGALAGAIVALGESLDIATVAEGIETTSRPSGCASLGCTYGQGYYFAQPIGEADLANGIAGLVSGAGGSDPSAEAVEAAPRSRRRRRSRPQPELALEPGQA